MKRANDPVFWALFGAGGMLSALAAPMLIFITGIAVPTGIVLPSDVMSYPHVLSIAHSSLGKLFLSAVVSLFLWHAVHRIYHSLHDLGIHPGKVATALLYGLALAGTVLSGWLVLAIGF